MTDGDTQTERQETSRFTYARGWFLVRSLRFVYYISLALKKNKKKKQGKYIKLLYDDDFRLVGARTEHFLLEKSRLVQLEQSERSYHILYQASAFALLVLCCASPC